MRFIPPLLLASLALACAHAPRSPPDTAAPSSERHSPVACKDLSTLRELRQTLSQAKNPRTGHTLEYTVIGDGAASDELVLFFNGTGGILPDWPMQLLTNRAHSPGIAHTGAFNADEESPVSLCHDYRLVLFDYPGVGDAQASALASFDQVADDVDAMLADLSTHYGLSTSRVSLVGWSLGTLAALKYAFLSPAARPERTVKDIILIATKAGGAVDGFADGNGAPCVTTIFDTLKSPTLSPGMSRDLRGDMFRVMFPYEHQQPNDGPTSDCSATVDTATQKVQLSVTLAPCSPGTACGKMLADYVLNRMAEPWRRTQGVPQDLYVQQREIVHDWNECVCATPGADFHSTGCSCSKPPQLSDSNGGVCQSRSGEASRNAPVSSHCAPLKFSGRLTAIHGQEDLFIQWTYGRALVEAYQQAQGPDKARLVLYDGADGAGHGVLLQHPRWVQERIHEALSPH